MKRNLLLILVALLPMVASAYDAKIDGIYYNFSGNEATVTYQKQNYPHTSDYSDSVVIPESVTYEGKTYSVTSIGDYAFQYCTGVTSVTIPNSVTSIGDYAFHYCSGLTSITIPNSVLSIGEKAFSGCSGLTSVAIPNSVTSIGISAFDGCNSLTSVHITDLAAWCNIDFGYYTSNPFYYADHLYLDNQEIKDLVIPNSVTSISECAFYGCTCLTSITIPKSVTSIGSSAFYGCSGLTSIVVESGNIVYDSRNNCNAIIETASNTLIVGCKNTIIPNSVTSIGGGGAFYGCRGLTSITIPNSVTSIGSSAFANCTGLTSITIPNSVTMIGNYAFRGCSGLTSVHITDLAAWCNIAFGAASNPLSDAHLYMNGEEIKDLVIPNSVTSIGDYAFQYCSGLTSVTIPNSVTSIGNSAFYGCRGLTSITIPNSVTSIGSSAFANCTGLTSITIPNSVTMIGNYAFRGCSGLTSVHITDLAAWCNIAFGAASNPLSDAHLYMNGEEIKDLVIPNSVTSIGDYAFQYCSGLTSVTIPNSVTSIGNSAFYGCSGLTFVRMKNTTPVQISYNTFSNQENVNLYVPVGSKAAYGAAEYWNKFKEIIEVPRNEIYMPDVIAVNGTQLTLPIALRNEDDITGIQMDLYLPEGMTVATNSRGKLRVSVTDRMEGNYSLSCHTMQEGYVRITGFSPDVDSFAGDDGDILNVTVNIDSNLVATDYKVYLKNIVLSDINNTELHLADTVATVQVAAQGDVDFSGSVNINDVVCIVNHILNRETGTFLDKAADVDGSGSININDVVVLIDRYILQRSNAPRHAQRLEAGATEDLLYLDDLYMVEGETLEIAVKLSNTHNVRAVQGNIKLPAGFSFAKKSNGHPDVRNLNERSEDFTLSCAIQDDGSMTFTQYSIDGYTYEGNEGGIFTIKVTADAGIQSGTYSMSLTDVILSIEGKAYEQPDSYSSLLADGIKAHDALDVHGERWYDLQGRKIAELQKGINIIRYSDGSTRKVMVK